MPETLTAVHERPIIFGSEMIQRILAGEKTMTRRTSRLDDVNASPDHWTLQSVGELDVYAKPQYLGRFGAYFHSETITPGSIRICPVVCPYGRPGDQLWVKEAWHKQGGKGPIVYAADEPDFKGKKTSPLFLPRRLSRILLEVTAVRVERVQSISETDALAEGFTPDTCEHVLKKAAQGIKPEEAYCAEKPNDGTENDGWLCHEHAKRYAGKNGYVGWGCTPESDGPAFCDECYKPLTISLTKYGIERELRIEDDPEGKEPKYFPCTKGDAAIAGMIASGIGDLRKEHHGRLAQIGFSTAWNLLHGAKAWDRNDFVWVVSFERLESPHA